MKIPFYHVDAFASRPFEGNPAAVCPLESWLPDATLQGIAGEHNLSETAFYVPRGSHYELRWFTPEVEVDVARDGSIRACDFRCSPRNSGKSHRFKSKSGEPVTRLRKTETRSTRRLCPASEPCSASPD
jgi:PhzF family phenazine biosynthesis protein